MALTTRIIGVMNIAAILILIGLIFDFVLIEWFEWQYQPAELIPGWWLPAAITLARLASARACMSGEPGAAAPDDERTVAGKIDHRRISMISPDEVVSRQAPRRGRWKRGGCHPAGASLSQRTNNPTHLRSSPCRPPRHAAQRPASGKAAPCRRQSLPSPLPAPGSPLPFDMTEPVMVLSTSDAGQPAQMDGKTGSGAQFSARTGLADR